MRFSERNGFKPIKEQLQIENIDIDLKNSIWSLFLESYLKKIEQYNYNSNENKLLKYCYELWLNFFKIPIDKAPVYSSSGRTYVNEEVFFKFIRDFFFSNSTMWYEIYDLIEYSSKYFTPETIITFNKIFEREKSAYRFIDNKIIAITSKEEIEEIEEAIAGNTIFNSVNDHLKAATNILSEKNNPIYRNSIKESISAVESLCKIYTNNDKATLGETLSILEKNNQLHPALKKSISSLYGYASDGAGIRHGLKEDDIVIDFHEAKFILVVCVSFINYLKSKMI
ncbi:AbiJ-NTD4 domain-containing protein [Flavobacterium solisilvae]|uniref:HEPN AbiJ-N-terminal domain-containing protein n=1 Tax=Flavobacterium solisilvae TaxID=1852019 RepID=A0ABX1QZY6_9FLAO|nr:hypothetical protein [Flavobacterium solisilvae]NMH26379.1 hypothetical protein [Flavobacterium solisilvae]